jgi:hypothetical protein
MVWSGSSPPVKRTWHFAMGIRRNFGPPGPASNVSTRRFPEIVKSFVSAPRPEYDARAVMPMFEGAMTSRKLDDGRAER